MVKVCFKNCSRNTARKTRKS